MRLDEIKPGEVFSFNKMNYLRLEDTYNSDDGLLVYNITYDYVSFFLSGGYKVEPKLLRFMHKPGCSYKKDVAGLFYNEGMHLKLLKNHWTLESNLVFNFVTNKLYPFVNVVAELPMEIVCL